MSVLYLIASLLIVALGQPAGITWLGPLSAVLGYAFFWKTLLYFTSSKQRFWLAVFWFALVQAIQLSWMTSIQYQGIYILVVYFLLIVGLGLQFGALSLLVRAKMDLLRIFTLASLWTLMEWMRLFFFCGFSWNPAGMALTSYIPSMQMAAIGGVFLLSFWVILVNLLALNKNFFGWGILAIFPYCFGSVYLPYQEAHGQKGEPLSVALVQPGLIPSEKMLMKRFKEDHVSFFEQWRRIFSYLQEANHKKVDLIVLPEAAVPYNLDAPLYYFSQVLHFLPDHISLPPLHFPYIDTKIIKERAVVMASNAFWAQSLANLFGSEVIVGMDAQDKVGGDCYNAAFHFFPHSTRINRYEKRILLPLAEYLPFDWCRPLAANYGIVEFFTQGKEAKLFKGVATIAPSICYEETFSDLMREGKSMGAEILVNLTNDGYYPFSSLPKQHFFHARLRSIENGIPSLRACNTGVTAVIDSFGRILAQFGDENGPFEKKGGALFATITPLRCTTLYTFCGDGGIIGICLIFVGLFFKRRALLTRASSM